MKNPRNRFAMLRREGLACAKRSLDIAVSGTPSNVAEELPCDGCRERGSNLQIEKWMTRQVHCVKPLDSIRHARELMEQHRINQLPVVVNGRVVGIVSDRDLRDAFPSVFDAAPSGAKTGSSDPGQITVETVMTSNVITLGPKDSVAEGARVMRRERIGAIPIVDGGKLAGILTRSDLLDALAQLDARA
jgi:acetoin utilization protein AcuB